MSEKLIKHDCLSKSLMPICHHYKLLTNAHLRSHLKKSHLIDLCKDNAIKSAYWPFYEQLRSSETAVEGDCNDDSD